MKNSLWILAVASSFFLATASAQDPGLMAVYGRGVHAYFGGQDQQAYEALTTAVDAETQDPRVYYFRGLVHQRLGRPQEAEADFRTAAELEHQDVGGVYGVDRALMRIQGPTRLAIERYRAAARLGASQEVILERQRRAISAQEAAPHVSAPGQQVLSEQPADVNALPAPGAKPPVKGEVDQPFNDPAGQPNAPAPPQPGPPAPAAPKPPQGNPLEEAPVNAPAKPAPPAAPANPFGAPANPPPAKPAEPMPGAENPFGAPATPPPAKPAEPKPAGDNPFGAPANPPAAPPLAAPPAAAPPAAAPPAANPDAATPPADTTSGSGRAFGNALRRAFGGLMPSLPEVPAGLPLGGEAPPEANPAQPANPPAVLPPAAAPPAAAPPAANDNPFAQP